MPSYSNTEIKEPASGAFHYSLTIQFFIMKNLIKPLLAFVLPLCVIFLLVQCQRYSEQDIVFKLGDLAVTNYELNRSIVRELGEDVNTTELKEWKENFIEEMYILYESLKSGYDTITEINEFVTGIERQMIAQYKGYLWKKVEEPKLKFTESNLKEAYKKSSQIYYIDYLVVDKTKIGKLRDYEILLREKDYQSFSNLSKLLRDSNHVTKNLTYIYPSLEYPELNQHIDKFKEKSFLHIDLRKDDNVALLFIKKTEPSGIVDFKSYQKNVYPVLYQLETENLITSKQRIIANLAKAEIDSSVCFRFFELLKDAYPNKISIKENETIFKYFKAGKEIFVGSANFLKYYYNRLSIPNLRSINDFYALIPEYIRTDYLNDEARGLGIYNEFHFTADRNFFKNTQIIDYYKKEILKKIRIDEENIYKQYITNPTRYCRRESFSFEVLSFNDLESANKAYIELSDTAKGNVGKVVGIIDVSQITIKGEEINKLADNLRQIITLSIGEISKPIFSKGKSVLYRKINEGPIVTIPLNEIKYAIRDTLLQQELNIILASRIDSLRKTIVPEINKISDFKPKKF